MPKPEEFFYSAHAQHNLQDENQFPKKFVTFYRTSLSSPASFSGFSKLLSLDLHEVIFYGVGIQTFISSCSHLERLRLVKCGDSNSLEINAPNLRYLHLVDGVDEVDLFLRNVPKLVDLSVRGLSTPTEPRSSATVCLQLKFFISVLILRILLHKTFQGEFQLYWIPLKVYILGN